MCLEGVAMAAAPLMLFGCVGENEGFAAVVMVYDCFVELLVGLKYISCQIAAKDLLSGMWVRLLGMTSLRTRRKAVEMERATLLVRT